MSRRLFILTLVLITLSLTTSTGIQAKGPPEDIPGIGICSAPTLTWAAEECEVGVRARQLTAEEVSVGMGQTRVERAEQGPFDYCYQFAGEGDMGGQICFTYSYRVMVSVNRLGLMFSWLVSPGPYGGAVLERVDSPT